MPLGHRVPVVVHRPHVVRVGQPEVLVEAVLQRQVGLLVAQVPLAHGAGGVAPALQQLGDGDLVRVQAHLRVRAESALDPDPLGVAPREQGRTGRRAHRLRRVEVGEAHPLGRQPVQVRRGEPLGPVHADIRPALVIGEDEDDVRRIGPGVRPPAQPVPQSEGQSGGPGATNEFPADHGVLLPAPYAALSSASRPSARICMIPAGGSR